MTTGISLHIGVNEVDPDHYGSKHQLDGCENDALAMANIASARGFTKITRLLSREATSSAVTTAIDAAALALGKGDIFWLSFSGHGAVVENGEGPPDEPIDQA